MSYTTASVPGMGSNDGIGRATMLGERRGYDSSQVILPHVLEHTTPEQREALRKVVRFDPHVKIVWERVGGRWRWETAEHVRVRDELLVMARRRSRGIRKSLAELARWTGSSPDTVGRILRTLAARGMATLSTGRGRYARAIFVLVAQSMPQPLVSRDAALTPAEREARFIERYKRRYTPEEWAELMAQGELWRYRLALHLSELGFDGPNAQTDYLRFMGHTGELRLS